MKHILFDSDLLGDDLLALQAMVKDGMDVVGVCGYGRRTTALDRCRIAQVFLERLDASGIPLVPGADRPLLQEPLVGCTFCDDAMQALRRDWDSTKVYANPILAETHAANFLVEQSKKHDGLVLLCTGPLTNVAIAAMLDPDFLGRFERIVIMGAVVSRRGNSSPVAEANFYNDPEAAHIVLSRCSGATIVPLDVTLQVAIDSTVAETCVDPFLRDVAKACCHAHACKGGEAIMPLHDLLAYLVVADPTIVQTTLHAVDVETGNSPARAMLVLGCGEHHHCIAQQVDVPKTLKAFKQYFLENKE